MLVAPVVVTVLQPVLQPVVIPWQAPIMHVVAAGAFSPGVGDALLRGLDTLDQAITGRGIEW